MWGIYSVQATTALNMMKRPNSKKISVVRRRNEWDLFEPVVEILSEKEVEALYMREERNARYSIFAFTNSMVHMFSNPNYFGCLFHSPVV
jgi:hypothetical protein